jgi:hypothetical protein
MVEYALLLASTSLRTFAADVETWAAGLNWHALAYALFGLVTLRIAFWAFRTSDY